jgi:hypothetical protein
MADKIKQAEEWLLIPENNVGQETAHRTRDGEPLCGGGVINAQCELCRLSLMLAAYRVYDPGGQPLLDDQILTATRFLARLKELDPPALADNIRAVLVLRDSDDPEALRLAGKCALRNLQRLEDALDDAKDEVEAWRNKGETVI